MSDGKILLLGGSGFISGTLARRALAQGLEVWAVTRGQKPLPEGVIPLRADRKDPAALKAAVLGAKMHWDLVVDSIAYDVEDILQDLDLFSTRAGHLVFIASDFVFDPAQRRFPQPFDHPATFTDETYGGRKRRCELELVRANPRDMRWTVFRPCHVYGPGSNLGCLPNALRDPELLRKMKEGKPIELVGGGRFLQQPIFAPDLAELILSVRGNVLADRKIYCSAGPDIVESVEYYRMIAKELGVDLQVEDLPVNQALAANPDWRFFLCHRIYDLSPLRLDGLKVPNTPLRAGLREQIRWLSSR